MKNSNLILGDTPKENKKNEDLPVKSFWMIFISAITCVFISVLPEFEEIRWISGTFIIPIILGIWCMIRYYSVFESKNSKTEDILIKSDTEKDIKRALVMGSVIFLFIILFIVVKYLTSNF